MKRSVILAGMGFVLAILCACSTPAHQTAAADDETYALVYLTSGPKSGQGEKSERQAMFAGHMGNIKRLADEGVLVIAGPFSKPSDKTWRGIMVLAVSSVEAAGALAATDPGVQAGEFTPVVKLMRASPVLHRTMDFERERERQQMDDAPGNPSSPPPNIRAYVMVTTNDKARTWSAIDRLGWRERVVWSGEFVNASAQPSGPAPAGHDPQAVIVLDATEPAEIRASLAEAGDMCVDGWWSTTSLLKLRTATPR